MVFKLDFRKAFDSVSWEALLTILSHRGFPQAWTSWLSSVLFSSKTAILLNDIPGNWINCQCGLRQGDPLSPYLFLLVADLLQQLIIKAFTPNSLCHPIDPSRPPAILQYADDTLIIARADSDAAETLQSILNDFADATRLTINFHKTTFLPMHTPAPTANAISATFNCPRSSFPHIYLGLPLSLTKLPSSAFQSIVQNYLKYLVGWVARLLSISSSLDAPTTYFMSVFRLPKKKNLNQLDAIRRAFFWSAEDTCTGGSVL